MAVSSDNILLIVGNAWVLNMRVVDVDGCPVDAVPVVTVTLPDGTTALATVETISTGVYRSSYTVSTTGRHIATAVFAGGYGTNSAAAYVMGTTTAAGMPTTDDVAAYLREGAASWDTEDLQDALDAEAAAQRHTCRVGAVYPDDLRQALLRRVQRNLAMRGLPLAVDQGDAGISFIPGRDPEVRRLEGPHRRLVVG